MPAIKYLVPRITYEMKGPPEGTKRRRWCGRRNIKPTLHPRNIRDDFVCIYVSIDIRFRLLSMGSSSSSPLSHLILFVSSAVFSAAEINHNFKVMHRDLESPRNVQQHSYVHAKRIIFGDS